MSISLLCTWCVLFSIICWQLIIFSSTLPLKTTPEMKRLMRVYGSLKCLRNRTPKDPDKAAKVESVKRKFYRWFPDLDQRFERTEEGWYQPKAGHEEEMAYRERMRKSDQEKLVKKRVTKRASKKMANLPVVWVGVEESYVYVCVCMLEEGSLDLLVIICNPCNLLLATGACPVVSYTWCSGTLRLRGGRSYPVFCADAWFI